MKTKKRGGRRAKGFTLVEMLIVIIIIGILAGMIMLSTGAATDKAEATRIISDMRSVKTACVMYYADYGEWPTEIDDNFDKYLDVPISDNDNFELVTSENVLWLRYSGGKLAAGNGVSERLAAAAADSGLYASASDSPNTPDYDGDGDLYMIVKK